MQIIENSEEHVVADAVDCCAGSADQKDIIVTLSACKIQISHHILTKSDRTRVTFDPKVADCLKKQYLFWENQCFYAGDPSHGGMKQKYSSLTF